MGRVNIQVLKEFLKRIPRMFWTVMHFIVIVFSLISCFSLSISSNLLRENFEKFSP